MGNQGTDSKSVTLKINSFHGAGVLFLSTWLKIAHLPSQLGLYRSLIRSDEHTNAWHSCSFVISVCYVQQVVFHFKDLCTLLAESASSKSDTDRQYNREQNLENSVFYMFTTSLQVFILSFWLQKTESSQTQVIG